MVSLVLKISSDVTCNRMSGWRVSGPVSPVSRMSFFRPQRRVRRVRWVGESSLREAIKIEKIKNEWKFPFRTLTFAFLDEGLNNFLSFF